MAEAVIHDSSGKPLLTIELDEGGSSTQGSPVRGEGRIDKSLEDLGHVGDAVAATCKEIASRVRAGLADAHPDEFELSFGVTLGAEGGLPGITKAKGEATFEVRATWRRQTSEPNGT